MQIAYESAKNGATTVCLILPRTDARWFHRFAMKGEIRLLRERLEFEGGKYSDQPVRSAQNVGCQNVGLTLPNSQASLAK
jgi:hypothetical protein